MFGYDVFLSEHPEFQALRRERNEARAAAFYAAAQPLRQGLSVLAELGGQAIAGYRRWRLQQQVVRDLSVLNDRVLRDIGVTRRDIRAIARSYAHKPQSGVTAAQLAPAESAALSKPKTATQPPRPRLAAIEGGRRETQRQLRPAVRPAGSAAQRQVAVGCG